MDVLRKGCAVCPSFRFLRYQTGGFSEEVCNKSQRGYRTFFIDLRNYQNEHNFDHNYFYKHNL